jgi:hypothetical protein
MWMEESKSIPHPVILSMLSPQIQPQKIKPNQGFLEHFFMPNPTNGCLCSSVSSVLSCSRLLSVAG